MIENKRSYAPSVPVVGGLDLNAPSSDASLPRETQVEAPLGEVGTRRDDPNVDLERNDGVCREVNRPERLVSEQWLDQEIRDTVEVGKLIGVDLQNRLDQDYLSEGRGESVRRGDRRSVKV
ncbi:hypothetical protein L1987_52913 [Smallanthus sonchifolius]|uniref:Uncharacterized protein n=1 Tax=Smallanthus sonchifolius TaxID=185202 RepID=A0ACB9EV85_9ASTR|nr:hypothetical protein L1987_52913 [Smallanthus sonchifolius]